MKKFIVLIIVAVWIFAGTSNILAQTTVYYLYDGSGNRTARTITLPAQKSAKVSAVDSVQADLSNKKKEIFEDNLGNQKILIYPNPTQGQLLVEIQGYEKETSTVLYLYDLNGKLLMSIKPVNKSMPLNLSAYPIGNYVLKIVLGDKKSEWKIVKE